jgi:hypothetical protein
VDDSTQQEIVTLLRRIAQTGRFIPWGHPWNDRTMLDTHTGDLYQYPERGGWSSKPKPYESSWVPIVRGPLDENGKPRDPE